VELSFGDVAGYIATQVDIEVPSVALLTATRRAAA